MSQAEARAASRWTMVAATVLAALATPLAGCLQEPGPDAEPRTHEVTLYVHAGASDTIPLYTMADGNQSRSVAITFKRDPSGEQRVPGPEIRVKEGDTVILHLVNLNPLPHTLHLHGGLVPWEMDGVDYLTEFPTPQGGNRTYTFKDLKAGTYWYHCHLDGAHHIDFGMYGAFIVEEREPAHGFDREYVVLLDEWDTCHVHGNTEPLTGQEMSPDWQASTQCYYRFLLDNLAQNRLAATTAQNVPPQARAVNCPLIEQIPESDAATALAKRQLLAANGCDGAHGHGTPPPNQEPRTWWPETHPVYNPEYNAFILNGKAFPDSPVFPVREGETVLFRLINAGNEWHTWHPHGHSMLVTHKDGYALPAAYRADTVSIGPGERYDVLVAMDNPGLWMVHDQNGLATANDNVHPGGMMACFPYDGFRGVDAFAMERALDCNTAAMAILQGHGHG